MRIILKQLRGLFVSSPRYNYYLATFFAGVLIYAALQVGTTPVGWLIVSYGTLWFIMTFGVGFGIHRISIHKAARVPTVIRRLACFVAVASATSSPVLWAGSHYAHHKSADVVGEDPHTPKLGLRILFGFYDSSALSHDKPLMIKALREFGRDPIMRLIHHWYFALLFGWWIGLFAFGGNIVGLWIGLVPSALGFYGLMLLNYFAHTHSPTAYSTNAVNDNSLNVPWLWVFWFGENWHNNHHAAPRGKTTKCQWWEVDMVYFWIWMFDIDRINSSRILIKIKLLKMYNRFKSHTDYIY